MLDVEFQATGDAVVQEAVVHADVVRSGLFPLQVGAVATGLQQVSAVVHGAGAAAEGIVGHIHIVTYVLLAGYTIAQAQFQVGEHVTALLHEVLIDDAPSQGHRGEQTPAVVLAEAGGTVSTEGSCQQVAIHQIVVQTSEEGHQIVLPRTGAAVGVVVTLFRFIPSPRAVCGRLYACKFTYGGVTLALGEVFIIEVLPGITHHQVHVALDRFKIVYIVGIEVQQVVAAQPALRAALSQVGEDVVLSGLERVRHHIIVLCAFGHVVA